MKPDLRFLRVTVEEVKQDNDRIVLIGQDKDSIVLTTREAAELCMALSSYLSPFQTADLLELWSEEESPYPKAWSA